MHVSRLSPRRVDGKKNQWLFQNLRQSVHRAALEEKKLPGAEFGLLAFVAHPECPPPGKDVEVFVALQVVMRRRASVDTENPRARDLPVDQIVMTSSVAAVGGTEAAIAAMSKRPVAVGELF